MIPESIFPTFSFPLRFYPLCLVIYQLFSSQFSSVFETSLLGLFLFLCSVFVLKSPSFCQSPTQNHGVILPSFLPPTLDHLPEIALFLYVIFFMSHLLCSSLCSGPLYCFYYQPSNGFLDFIYLSQNPLYTPLPDLSSGNRALGLATTYAQGSAYMSHLLKPSPESPGRVRYSFSYSISYAVKF